MYFKTRKHVKRLTVEIIGVGVALACIFWVLGHLVAFYFFGYVLIGEGNRLVLFSEIALITLGLLCFLTIFVEEKTEKSEFPLSPDRIQND